MSRQFSQLKSNRALYTTQTLSWRRKIISLTAIFLTITSTTAYTNSKGWYDLHKYSPITYGIESLPDQNTLSLHEVCKAITRSFEAWSSIANITFSELDYGQNYLCNPRTRNSRSAYRRYGNHYYNNGQYIRRHLQPIIRINFFKKYHGDNFAFDGRSNQLAHAFYPSNNELGGDMHFDLDEIWTVNDDRYEGTDLFYVAVHELGHALGLDHDTVDEDSIMYESYKSINTKNFDELFTHGDRRKIQKLYGAPYNKYGYDMQNSYPRRYVPRIIGISKGKTSETGTSVVPKGQQTKNTNRKDRRRSQYAYNSKNKRTQVVKKKRKRRSQHKKNLCKADTYDAAGFYNDQFWVFLNSRLYILGQRKLVTYINVYFPEISRYQTVNDFFQTQPFTDRKNNYIAGYLYITSGDEMYKYLYNEGTGRFSLVTGWPRTMQQLKKIGNSQIVGSTYWEKSKTVYMFDSSNQYYRYMPSVDQFIRHITNYNRRYKRTYPMEFEKVLGRF